ncbi:MAG: polysaccharide deacetylase family protein [Oscillospiraceae bacterium]|nr:polysaccharide deacetylase family protein [Oscillospiraceae bacterium]
MRRLLVLILLAAILITSGAIPALAKSENWGLSFPHLGETPVGTATPEALLELNAYFVGDTSEKVIYLTFDAGFENGNTPPILDALKAAEIPAAFFLVGTYIRDNPDLIRRMVEEGHTVGNHTMRHPDMSAITDRERFQAELMEVERHYEEIIGAPMTKLYRPPNGKYSTENLKLAQELGYTTLFWSLAYVDWNVDAQPSRQQAFDKLIPRIHPGAIVMLHNTSSTNAEIMAELIGKYQELGYRFGCVTELVR